MVRQLLAMVTGHDEEADARAAARRLVEAGIGAEVIAAASRPEGEPPAHAWEVRVLPEDQRRACEHLGVEAPAEVVEAEDASARTSPPWKSILLIWLVAMIVIPLLAFWITVQLTK